MKVTKVRVGTGYRKGTTAMYWYIPFNWLWLSLSACFRNIFGWNCALPISCNPHSSNYQWFVLQSPHTFQSCSSHLESCICPYFEEHPPFLLFFLLSLFFCLLFPQIHTYMWGFPDATVVKNLPVNAGDARVVGSIPGLGRSPREGNGNPLQYSCLGNSMDRGAWRATVHGATKSQAWLSTHTETYTHMCVCVCVCVCPCVSGQG